MLSKTDYNYIMLHLNSAKAQNYNVLGELQAASDKLIGAKETGGRDSPTVLQVSIQQAYNYIVEWEITTNVNMSDMMSALQRHVRAHWK